MDNCVGILMTGAQAGVWYLETLQQKARLSRGRSTYVLPVKTLTVPFEDINLFLPDNMHMAASRILPYFREMNVMGVSRYILANITLHEAFDLVSDQIHGNGLLHLREIIREVFDHKINIMLVGSMYTMKGTYLSGLFTRSPVTIVEADEATQRELDHLRKLFYTGKDHKEATLVFARLLARYPQVDRFVLACTEHAMAIAGLADRHRFISLPELQIEYLLKNQ